MADTPDFRKYDDDKFTAPWSYGLPKPGAGILSDSVGSLMGPMYSSIMQSLKLDPMLIRALTGGDVLSTRGGAGYNNVANTLIERQQSQNFSNMYSSASRAAEDAERRLNENMRKAFGSSPMDARAGAAAATSGMSLSGMLTGWAMDVFDRPGMKQEFAKMSVYGNAVFNNSSYGTADRRAEGMKSFFGLMQEDYMTNTRKYGSLSGREAGAMSAELMRRGVLRNDIDDLGGDPTNVNKRSKLTSKLQSYAQALGPLKEIFNKDIPELMDKMDEVFGGNAATSLSPEQIRAKGLQLKHVAHMTGTSVETLTQMATMSRNYMEMAGGMGIGSDVVATETAKELASGAMPRWMSAEKYRGSILKMRSSEHASRFSEFSSGAFVAWAKAKGKDLDDPKNWEEFVAKTRGATTVDDLSARTGISADMIRGAAEGENAIAVRAKYNVGEVAWEGKAKAFMDRQQASRRDILGSSIASKLTRFTDLGSKEAMDAYYKAAKESGLSAAGAEALLGTAQNSENAIARVLTGHASASAFTADRESHIESKRRQKAINEAKATEEKYKDTGVGGGRGLVTALMQNNEYAVSDITRSWFGLTGAKESMNIALKGVKGGQVISDTLRKYISEGGTEEEKKTRALDVADMHDMLVMGRNAAGKEFTKEEKEKIVNDLQNGGADAMQSSLDIVTGRAAKAAAITDKDAQAKYLELARSGKGKEASDMLKTNLSKQIAKNVLRGQARELGAIDYADTVAVKKALGGTEAAEYDKQMQDAGAKLGLNFKQDSTDILEAILKILQTFQNSGTPSPHGMG